MGSPAYGALTLLQNMSVVNGTTGWAGFLSRLPDSPDRAVNMVDTSGQTPNPKHLLDIVTIQALIRGVPDSYVDTWNKAKDVKDALLGLPSQEVNGDWWSGVLGLGDLALVSYDSKSRPIFSVNFRIFVEPPASQLGHRESL